MLYGRSTVWSENEKPKLYHQWFVQTRYSLNLQHPNTFNINLTSLLCKSIFEISNLDSKKQIGAFFHGREYVKIEQLIVLESIPFHEHNESQHAAQHAKDVNDTTNRDIINMIYIILMRFWQEIRAEQEDLMKKTSYHNQYKAKNHHLIC